MIVRSKLHVLLIDDDVSIAAGLQELLEWDGHTVTVLGEGAGACSSVQSVAPHVVVLDIGLPDMSGVSVHEALRLQWLALPIVFASGHANRSDLPMDDHTRFLRKPYEYDLLMSTISDLLALGPRLVESHGSPSQTTPTDERPACISRTGAEGAVHGRLGTIKPVARHDH